MVNPNNIREQVGQLSSVVVGLVVALSLHHALLVHKAAPVKIVQGKPVIFSFKAKGAPVQAPSALATRIIPIESPTAPVKSVKKVDSVKQTIPVPVSQPIIEIAAYDTLQQPAFDRPTAPSSQHLPMLMEGNTGSEGKPPMPSDDYIPPQQEYLETPGGDVLVLQLTVDETGKVIDSQIKVPSHDGLQDVSWASIALTQQFSEVQPPIKPGERRVLEVRINIPSKTPSILP